MDVVVRQSSLYELDVSTVHSHYLAFILYKVISPSQWMIVSLSQMCLFKYMLSFEVLIV